MEPETIREYYTQVELAKKENELLWANMRYVARDANTVIKDVIEELFETKREVRRLEKTVSKLEDRLYKLETKI